MRNTLLSPRWIKTAMFWQPKFDSSAHLGSLCTTSANKGDLFWIKNYSKREEKNRTFKYQDVRSAH